MKEKIIGRIKHERIGWLLPEILDFNNIKSLDVYHAAHENGEQVRAVVGDKHYHVLTKDNNKNVLIELKKLIKEKGKQLQLDPRDQSSYLWRYEVI